MIQEPDIRYYIEDCGLDPKGVLSGDGMLRSVKLSLVNGACVHISLKYRNTISANNVLLHMFLNTHSIRAPHHQ